MSSESSDRKQAKEQHQTLTKRAHETIRDAIVGGRLGAGAQLVEAEIAERLGMSKTPVREALVGLAREGLVEISDFRGARVAKFSASDALEVFQLRSALEPLAVRLSFPAMGEADYEQLDELLLRARDAHGQGDWVLLARLNREFHAGLHRKCPNTRVLAILGQLADTVQLLSVRGWMYRPTHAAELDEHEAILAALRQGREPDEACALLTSHVLNFISTHTEDGVWD